MVPFSKYSGAGNDFVVVDAEDAPADPAELARRICPRATGVGVDGMALVRGLGPGELEVRFFNPDGSEFATCGNGSRCVARWAADGGRAPEGRVRLVTGEGEVEASLGGGDDVSLDYEIEAWVEGRRRVPWGEGERAGWLVQIGTPHFVLPLDEMPDGPIEGLCRPLRHHPGLGAGGANVDLVAAREAGRAQIRTFERGVEGETLACGSGAMAALLALHAAGSVGRDLRLRTRSGAELRVGLEDPGGADPGTPAARGIRLTGPARHVFDGRYPAPDDGDRAASAT